VAGSLDTYRLLGRSGLRVSPLALGTMTFGSDWGWGAGKDEARRIFDTYVDRGGNFIDSANVYTNGSAERLVGEFARDRRDSLVLATKYTMTTRAGDPNAGGNHRKSMLGSVENSLRRLETDYIDLLYLHAWDFTTPVEEVLRAMDDLVRAGKVLYVASPTRRPGRSPACRRSPICAAGRASWPCRSSTASSSGPSNAT
jgi:aryl-alcohol dehydrogenase-like predicted oxidoreductase